MEVSVSGFPLPRRATVAGQPTADSAAAKLGEDKALTARMGTEPACWTPTLQRRARQRPFGDSHSPLSILWTDGRSRGREDGSRTAITDLCCGPHCGGEARP